MTTDERPPTAPVADENDDELRLMRWFERTAAAVPAPGVTRLHVYARQTVARTRRRRLFAWLSLPALTAAFAGFAFTLGHGSLRPEPRGSHAAIPSSVRSVKPLPAGTSRSLAREPEPADLGDISDWNDDMSDALDGDLDPMLPPEIEATLGPDYAATAADEFDALYAPPPDADLDAWLRATEDLLHQGG